MRPIETTEVKLVNEIRASSRMGKLLKKHGDMEKLLSSILENDEYQDIHCVGNDGDYLYSEEEMSHSYMEMLLGMEEKNLPQSMAALIRRESKIYPRPTPSDIFKGAPFGASSEDIQTALDTMKDSEEYGDIGEVKASNGALYLFSNLYMTAPHARGLAEWVEVEQFDNP